MWGKKPTRIAHPLAHQFYNYHLGIRFDPGAMAEAFVPAFQLPVLSFRGRARLAGSLRVLQHPQVWFKQQRGVSGLGGIQAGQVLGQPLLDISQQFEGP
jgi:hypothetical protein